MRYAKCFALGDRGEGFFYSSSTCIKLKSLAKVVISTSPTYVIRTRRILTPANSTQTALEKGRVETAGMKEARMSLNCRFKWEISFFSDWLILLKIDDWCLRMSDFGQKLDIIDNIWLCCFVWPLFSLVANPFKSTIIWHLLVLTPGWNPLEIWMEELSPAAKRCRLWLNIKMLNGIHKPFSWMNWHNELFSEKKI